MDQDTRSSFILSISLVTVCAIATALRFVSTVHSGRKLGLEDWFALAALLAFVVHSSLVLESLAMYAQALSLDSTNAKLDKFLSLRKIVYAAIPFYPLNQLFAKFSILLLYYRLFSVKRSFVRWTYVLGTAQAADTVLTLAINLLGCHPVSLFWESLGRGWCLDQILVFAGTESINSAVDFAMVALASIMVSGIQLNLHTKLKLILLFVVGGLSGIIGWLRIIIYAYERNSNPLVYDITQNRIAWTFAQETASILCCCAPTYKNPTYLASLFTKLVSRGLDCTWWRRDRRKFTPIASQLWWAPHYSSESRLTWMELEGGTYRAPIMPMDVSLEGERVLLKP